MSYQEEIKVVQQILIIYNVCRFPQDRKYSPIMSPQQNNLDEFANTL